MTLLEGMFKVPETVTAPKEAVFTSRLTTLPTGIDTDSVAPGTPLGDQLPGTLQLPLETLKTFEATAGVEYVKLPKAVTERPATFTVTSTTPAVPAGVVQVILVPVTVPTTAAFPPNVTEVDPARKPVPVMTTEAPPASVLVDGLMAVIVGVTPL